MDRESAIFVLILVVVIYIVYIASENVEYFGHFPSLVRLDCPSVEYTYEDDSHSQSHLDRVIPIVPVDQDTDDASSDSWTNRTSMNNDDAPIENFQASAVGNPVIDQGTWDNAYALLSPPRTAGGKDSMSHREIKNQVPNTEFLDLITVIKTMISDKLISYAETCQEMHGHEAKPRLGDGKRALTLECVSDPYALQDEIIRDTYELIYTYIKDKFGINLNPYSVHHDLHMHMNLMEGLIYPLQYSGLYTVHGVQYTNSDWIRNKVQNDIDVRHILMTVFARRNIEVEVDTDQILH